MPRAKFYSVPAKPARKSRASSSSGSGEITFCLVWNTAGCLSEVATYFKQPVPIVVQRASRLRKRGYQLKKFKEGRPAGSGRNRRNVKKTPVYVPEAHTFDELNDKLRLGLSLSECEEARMSEQIRQRAAECRAQRDAGSPIISSGGRR